jgi:Zn-finger nucleic acid-binding protein
MKSAACPSCAATMEQRFFERKPAGKVELDFCFACHAIWFDQYESAALTPGGVIELFRVIHKQHDHRPRPLADSLRCPACRTGLVLTQDFQRSNRIAYYRCTVAPGRFTTFFQFLREKQFVRDLTGPEIDRLRANVKQVRCSSCGAPVDLGRNPQCNYCRAPVSILDADAVSKTLADLDAKERGRHLGDPQAIVEGLLQGRRPRLDGPVDPDVALAAVLARQGNGKARARSAATRRAGRPGPSRADGASRGGFLDLVSDAFEFLGD